METPSPLTAAYKVLTALQEYLTATTIPSFLTVEDGEVSLEWYLDGDEVYRMSFEDGELIINSMLNDKTKQMSLSVFKLETDEPPF